MRRGHRPLIVAAALASLAAAVAVAKPALLDAAGERRVEALLQKLTLAEKVGQLAQYPSDAPGLAAMVARGEVGAVLNVVGAEKVNALQRIAVETSRLHIPLLFGSDVIHGYRTIFPVPLASAGSFDPELIERSERIAAREASAAGVRWTFAPMVDIARDPRWGRIVEGAGEDPFLGAAIAAARVRGFQGRRLADPDSVVACPKHYVGYGAAQGGRDYDAADISEQTLREVYLPPFAAAVKAGAGTLMSAFNDLGGVPASANRHTLTEILRGEWRFDGFVVSDWGSIHELVAHGIAGDDRGAAAAAITAGVDMDMAAGAYAASLPGLVSAGVVPIAVVDEAVRRVLRVKVAAGLLDAPFADPAREKTEMLTPASRTVARVLARESIVLLKNGGALLPLAAGVKRIAVIGPLADAAGEQLGVWAGEGRAEDSVTPLAAIRARGAGATVLFSRGVDVASLTPTSAAGTGEAAPAPNSAIGVTAGAAESGPVSVAHAVATSRQADVALLFLGEPAHFSGEASSRATLELPGRQEELLRAVVATGRPVVLVLESGRPLDILWASEHVAAIVQAWHLGTETGPAIADVLFGDVAPSARLPVSWPRSIGQLPVFYDHKSTGRPVADDRWRTGYQYESAEPLYPFGHGLTYTTFSYADLRVGPAMLDPAGSARVAVDVRNEGARAAVEVVQLYVHDRVAPCTRPVRELKGFARVALAPGERRTVELTLAADDLAFFDPVGGWTAPAGAFDVWVGHDSGATLHASFEVTGPPAR
jgi:beta-glucosidase